MFYTTEVKEERKIQQVVMFFKFTIKQVHGFISLLSFCQFDNEQMRDFTTTFIHVAIILLLTSNFNY